MYLLDVIYKFLTKSYRKDEYDEPQDTPRIATDGEYIEVNEDYESCQHVFMPIDSTGEIFACTKCGQLIKKEDFKKKNPFTK